MLPLPICFNNLINLFFCIFIKTFNYIQMKDIKTSIIGLVIIVFGVVFKKDLKEVGLNFVGIDLFLFIELFGLFFVIYSDETVKVIKEALGLIKKDSYDKGQRGSSGNSGAEGNTTGGDRPKNDDEKPV